MGCGRCGSGCRGRVVVPVAEQDTVGEVGRAAVGPGGGVVGLAPGCGDVAVLGPAAGVAQGEGLALGGGEQPGGAAQVEDLGLGAQDGGDEAGGAGQPAGFAGGDGSPVPSCAVPSPVCRVSRGMVTITVVARPPWSGSRLGSRRSSRAQNARPRCRSAGSRTPVAGSGAVACPADVAWGGERFEVGLQAGRDGVGDGGGDVRGPVAATCEVQPGHGVGPLLGPLQRPAFLFLADLGCDHVEDPPAEPGQVGGPELFGVARPAAARPAG